MKELEVGKDYVCVYDNNLIVIDRVESFDNKGFYENLYESDMSCNNSENWREATEEEVIKAFKKYLVRRYGEDWETMKIKEKHPDLYLEINDGRCTVKIEKDFDGWNVWNKNGLLYCNGIWVERLEEGEKNKIMKKYRLKKWYPSLLKDVRVGDIITENGQHYKGVTYKGISYRVEIWQLHSDFWELIEEQEPLFTTEDGVEMLDRYSIVWMVRKKTLEKIKIHSIHLNECDFEHKVFAHESNADEYILWNKPLFSLLEIDITIEMYTHELEELIKLAKERIEE